MAAYCHFKNKHDLLYAVAAEGFQTLSERLEALLVESESDGLTALAAMGNAYVAFALANPALYRLMFGPKLTRETRPSSLQEAATRAFNLVPDTVARCQEQGIFRSGSSLALGGLLWSLMHGLIGLLIDGQLLTDGYEEAFPVLLIDSLAKQPKDADKLMDVIVDVMFWGLAPRPEQPTL